MRVFSTGLLGGPATRVAAMALGGALVVTALALGQRANQPAASTQPAGTTQPATHPPFGPRPFTAGPGAPTTQPIGDRLAQLRREREQRERERRERMGVATRPAMGQPFRPTPAPGTAMNPAGAAANPAAAPGTNGQMNLDAQRLQVPNETELERQAAAARMSAMHNANRAATQPALATPGAPMNNPMNNPPAGGPLAPRPAVGTTMQPTTPAVATPTAPGIATPTTPGVPPGAGAANAVTPGPNGQPVTVNATTGQPQSKPKDFWWLSPQDRPYFFNWNNTPLEKACHDLEEMSGLSMMGINGIEQTKKQAPISFQSNKLLSYDEALTRFDEIIFPLNYWVVNRENFLVIDQLTEWYRKIPPDRMYISYEDYRKAKLPLWEVASVMYTPKFRPAELLATRAIDVVPVNGARATLVPASGRIELKGFVYWMEHQLAVIEMEDKEGFKDDGRTVQFYQLKYATTTDAARLLQGMIPNPGDMSTGNPGIPRPPRPPNTPGAPGGPEGPGQTTYSQIDIQENARLQQLDVKANEVNHKLVKDYLEKYIDLPSDPKDKAELIPLKYQDPQELIDIIRPLLGERQMQQVPVQPRPNVPQPPPQPGQPPPMVNTVVSNSTAILTAVTASRSILVKANPDEMKFIKEYVKMLDVETPNEKFQFIELKYASATSVAAILNACVGGRPSRGVNGYPGIPAGTVSSTFHATADQSNDHALVISGEPKDVQDAKELVTKLDVDPDRGAIDQLVQLEHASPNSLAELLNSRYSTAGSRGNRFGGGGSSAANNLPKFFPDEASHTLVVVCQQDMWPEIERVIKEVDEKSVVKGTAKAYPLKHSNASTIAMILGQSFSNRGGSRFGGESGGGPSFQADPQSNRVLVTATQDIHEQVAKLIADLDQPSPSENAVLTPIELTSADAGYVASKIEDLFAPPGRGAILGSQGVQVPVRVVAEPVSNRVLVSASPEDFKKAEDLAKSIDQQFAARQVVRKTFHLQHVTGFKIEQALKTMFPEAMTGGRGFSRGGGGGSEDAPTAIRIVEAGDSIAVSAPKDKMADIERFITQIDTDPNKENEIRTYTVKGVDAEGTYGIAEKLDELFGAGRAAQMNGGKSNVNFIGDRSSNLLMVSAPSERMKEIDVQVQKLLAASEAKDMTFAIKHFDVKQATPEDVANMITPLLQARFTELQNAGGGRHMNNAEPQIMPQRTAHRVTVAAPAAMMVEIEELIKQFDQPTAASTMRIVALKTAKAVDIASVIEANVEGKGGGSGESSRRSRRHRSGFFDFSSNDSVSQRTGPEDLQVSAVESSNSLIMRGPEDLVLQAQELAKHLDADAIPEGPVIRIFDLPKEVDSYEMISLIEDLIGGGSEDSFSSSSSSRRSSRNAEGGITVKSAIGNRLIVSAPAEKMPVIEDLINKQGQMIKLAAATGADSDTLGGKTIGHSKGEITVAYEVKGPVEDIAKALDKILVDLYGYFDAPWVKSSVYAKQVIVTGKPEQFKMVKQYLDELEKNPPAPKLGVIVKRVPARMAGKIVEAVVANQAAGQVNAKALPISTRKERSAMELIERNEIKFDTPITSQPAAEGTPSTPASIEPAANRFVPPSAPLAGLRKAVAAVMIAQVAVTTQPAAAQTPSSQPAASSSAIAANPQALSATSQPAATTPRLVGRPQADVAPATPSAPASRPASESGIAAATVANPIAAAAAEAATNGKVQIRYDEDQGVIYVVGPVPQLEQMQKTIDDVIDQAEKLVNQGEEQPIRVFQLQHVDVNIAAAILETMFNDKLPGQQPGVQQPNRPNQQNPQQQAANAANKQQQTGNEKEGPTQGKDDKTRRRRRGGGEEEEKPEEEAGAKKKIGGGDRIRVMANTRDQSLIIRADRDDFPLIAELVLKIDRPADNPPQTFRVFPIKKLNAGDVEEVLKSVLKIEDNRGNFRNMGFNPGFGGSGFGGRGGGFGNTYAQTQMMEQLQQQMLDMQGDMFGAGTETEQGKVKLNPSKEITITSDAPTNTVIVLAPKEGMTLVEKLINQLENQESPVQIVTIKIKNAEAEKVATELERVFTGGGGAGGSSRSGRSSRRSSNGDNPFSGGFGGGMGFGGFGGSTPSRLGQDLRVSADNRTNTLIVRALAADIPKIKDIIEMMDVPMVEQVHLYPVEHGIASEMAKTLATIFAADEKAEGPQATRIAADADTNTLLVWAPQAQQTMIEVKIKELEGRASEKSKSREIQLKVASATAVAAKLKEIFVSKGAGRGQAQRISIEGDDNSSTLFVTAPKEVFEEIETVAQRLDTVTRQDIKVFQLKHAYAAEVYTMFTTMLTQQMAMQQGKGSVENMPSVVPDPRTNSLIVTGTPLVFLAVEKVLVQIDVPPTDNTQPTTAMFGLTKSTATTIAQSITALYANQPMPGGVKPPTAVGEPTANVVYVYGTKAQIDQIKATIIDKLEEYKPSGDSVIQDYQVQVKNAKVEDLAEVLNKYFQQKATSLGALGSASQPPADRVVTIVPDPSTRQLYITSNEKNKKLIESLLVTADATGISEAGRVNRVFPLQWASPASSAQAITGIVGSSRVDLQACKLEYSIVSPK